MPGAWRAKHDQKQAPGDYDILRLMTVTEDKAKGHKRLCTLPILERAKYGIIQKVKFFAKLFLAS